MGNCNCISNSPKPNDHVNIDNLKEPESGNDWKIQNSEDKKTPRGHNPIQGEMKRTNSPKLSRDVMLSFHNENQIKSSVITMSNYSFVSSPQDKLRKSIEVIQKLNKKPLNTREINVMLLGAETVGKSSFVIKIIEDKFENFYIVTLGVENFRKKFVYDGKDYYINFIVTSGSPEYKTDYSEKYKSVDFFLVFYDMTSVKTFDYAKHIVSEELVSYVCKYNGQFSNLFLIGNKLEIKEKKVNIKDVEFYCMNNGFDHFEISVKMNVNLNKVTNQILEIFNKFINEN